MGENRKQKPYDSGKIPEAVKLALLGLGTISGVVVVALLGGLPATNCYALAETYILAIRGLGLGVIALMSAYLFLTILVHLAETKTTKTSRAFKITYGVVAL